MSTPTIITNPLISETPPTTSIPRPATTIFEQTPAKPTIDASELDLLSIIERVGSCFSLLGCLFVITTFCCSKAFHKPINRLVFYASFGNMMTNVGTLMARSFIKVPNSVGCQFQAFLIQMFMPADACWTLAMAINVYLTFYFKFDAERLRKMEIPYLLCCYGIPFVPAFTYIFVSNSRGERVYGNATLWCWVTPEWDIWRIITFYGPVWLVIIATFFIYIRAGRTIYEKRKQLRNFEYSVSAPDSEDPYTMKTTEVYVTSEVMESQPRSAAPFNMARRGSEASANPRGNAAYSVTISSDKRLSMLDETGAPTPLGKGKGRNQVSQRRRNYELNNAAWSYTKCSLLFFTALLVTWIPSSANRVYSVIHANQTSTPLEFMSALVLPLQGFWNAIIYITTSWTACKNMFRDMGFSRASKVTELMGIRPGFMQHKGAKSYESESMTELRNSRANSNDRRRY